MAVRNPGLGALPQATFGELLQQAPERPLRVPGPHKRRVPVHGLQGCYLWHLILGRRLAMGRQAGRPSMPQQSACCAWPLGSFHSAAA